MNDDMKGFLNGFYDELATHYEATLHRLERLPDQTAAQNLEKGMYSVFYSNPLTTLGKGDIYFLGLNPGGSSLDEPVETVAEFERKEANWSEYTHEKWNPGGRWCPAGEAPLQKNIRECLGSMLKEFGKEPTDAGKVFSSNLYFFRSQGAKILSSYLNAKEVNNFARKWHGEFLRRVQPSLIICNGNSKGLSAFTAFKDWFPGASFEPDYPCYGTFSIKSFMIPEVPWEKKNVLVVGLPHLSRFHLQTGHWDYLKTLLSRIKPAVTKE